MTETPSRAWIDLDPEDHRQLLISLVGFGYGQHPETRLDAIRDDRRRFASSFIRLAGLQGHEHVLDLGSGCGFGTRALAERARRVTACDISPAYLDYARRECGDLNNVDFLRIENRDLSPVPDHSVDTVVSMSLFIHLNLYDISLYFNEFRRIIQPKGKVVFDFADADRVARPGRDRELFEEHLDYYRDNPGDLPGLMQFNSLSGIRAVAGRAGFRLRRRRGHKLLLVPKP